jgi:glutamate dehydrogenase (NAD(P)+)
MTWKWALVDIFLGGAKAAIVADPKAPNKEGIVRAFVRAIRKLLPDEYV